MAIAVKTYLSLSGLYNLSLLMFKNQKIYYIPKEKWIFKDGRYRKKIFIDKDIASKHKIWMGEKVDRVYSLETCMIDTTWMNKFKHMGAKIIDVPMIEWVQRKYFLSGKYNCFDKIMCLNDYCYNIFSNKYSISEKYDFDAFFKENIKKNKENIIYHQASCSSANSFKNTDAAIESFLNIKNDNYKMIITGILNDNQKRNIKNKNIDYKGIVSYEEIQSIFEKSKIYLSPSSQEGLSIPLYEAKSNGCKIITTNFPPMKRFGDYLCDVNISENKRFMYPRLDINIKSLIKCLNKATTDSL